MTKSILLNVFSLVLPLVVLVLVPVWLEPRLAQVFFSPEFGAADGGGRQFVAGAGVMLIGLLIMGHTIASFIRIGRGTLAPWSPTRKLVVEGLYAHVRNPMILGVLIVLLGEALAAASWRILAWALVFFLINTLYFVVSEEPGLERRFGEEYRRYKMNVPRWMPRLRPWRGR
jgi:protein-S-isoprenylcysteine O-methyltransferase Ste14